MPDLPEEKRYDTTTAKVFYKLRDLFIQKGSVYTAKGVNLVSVAVGGLVALLLVGWVLYRLSEPMGKIRQGANELHAPAAAKIPRDAKSEEKPRGSGYEEVLRKLTGLAGPPDAPKPEGPAADPSGIRPLDPTCGTGPAGVVPGTLSAEQTRAEAPLESSRVFERPRSDDKPSKEPIDYEYVDRIASAAAPTVSDKPPATVTAGTPSATGTVSHTGTGKPSLFQEVRARLLTRIDTSLPASIVVAEIARDDELAGFKLHRGDLLVGTVSAASPKRVSVTFNRLIDADKREHAIDAVALDLAGATGLAAKPADSPVKRGLLYANDRALDYARAFKGGISIYNNPVQGDLRALQNKAMIVEPNTEFYVIFQRIPSQEARP